MSITIQLDLPEDLAAKARAKGLLDPAQLAQLIAREVASSAQSQPVPAWLIGENPK